ncbi:MAG TPA: ketoacyl-ACP synthase III family protein [Pilimelia sp.]|nr:ketoacyl-ACP synthase III family protein [Pilimelia sp.]
MRYDDVWITGTGSVLGDLTPVAEAVADGRYAPADAAEAGLVSVSEWDEDPPAMAVRAGRAALAHAGGAATPGLHLHGSVYFQGLDLWSAACAVAAEVIGEQWTGLSLHLSGLSNSALAGLELAAGQLAGRPDLSAALVTAADRFAAPHFDRWNVDSGVVFGDGAGAAVLGRGAGRLRLLSSASFTDAGLVGLQRGDEPLTGASTAVLRPLVLRERARQFFAAGGHTPASVLGRSIAGVQRVTAQALAEADTSLDQLRWVCPPFVGQALFHTAYAEPLGLDPARTLHQLGRRVGHLGAVDQLVALDHLLRHRLVAPGDRLALIGVGIGFTFTCLVLEAGPRPR